MVSLHKCKRIDTKVRRVGNSFVVKIPAITRRDFKVKEGMIVILLIPPQTEKK